MNESLKRSMIVTFLALAGALAPAVAGDAPAAESLHRGFLDWESGTWDAAITMHSFDGSPP